MLDRIPQEELRSLMVGYGHNPYFFEATEDGNHADDHRRFARLLDDVLDEIAAIKARASAGDDAERSDEEERRNGTAGDDAERSDEEGNGTAGDGTGGDETDRAGR